VPVLLQVGSESLRELYVTDALVAAQPDARVEVLAGQAHEGMTTAPAQYVASVLGFLRADMRAVAASGMAAQSVARAQPGAESVTVQ